MNNKYVFNGNNWIVTSSEIKITPLDGTKPMHPALSKKLYNQNMQPYTRHKKPGVWWLIPLNAIDVKVTTINKYTIVELTHNNKHYHGLSSLADCDKENAVTGIAVAYHRAFEKMMNAQDNIPHNEKYHSAVVDYMNQCRPTCIKELSEMIDSTPSDKNKSKIQGSSPSSVVFDDYIQKQSKESLQESKAHLRKCLLGAFGVTDKEVGLKENMHKHNLKSHLKSIAKERSEFP